MPIGDQPPNPKEAKVGSPSTFNCSNVSSTTGGVGISGKSGVLSLVTKPALAKLPSKYLNVFLSNNLEAFRVELVLS